MSHKPVTYLQILLIELKDMEDDLTMLIEKCRESHDHDQISNYVFYENVSLMQRKIFGIEGLYSRLQSFDAQPFETVDAIITHIDAMVKSYCTDQGLPQSCYAIVKRKMDKIRQFMIE